MDYLTKSKEELISELAGHKQELDSLKILFDQEINSRNQIETVLKERIKELNCHDQISEVMSNSELSVDEICEKIVQIIPRAWQFPEIAGASIQIPNHIYSSPAYKPGNYSMVQDIKINQTILGQIEVCYPTDHLPATNQIFLPEESSLLFSIAVKLGNYIEKKEKDLALKVKQAKYKVLIENISDVIYAIDSDANITFISPSITRLLGYLPEEVIGKNFLNFVGASREQLQKRFEEIQKNIELQNEYQILSKSGEPHWIRFSSMAIITDEQFIGATGTLVDVTEKKQIELELQKSESLYRSILNASPDTVFIADLNGNVLFTSPMALKMFGYEETGFPLNSPLFDFVDPKDHGKARDAIRQMVEGVYTGATEYVGIKADGSTFDMEVNGEFIREPEGRPTSMIFIVRDISDRKSAEQKTINANRLYAVTSRINQSIVHLRDKDRLLKEACRIAIEFGKFQMAWIGLIDESTQTIYPFAFDGVEDGYLATIGSISISDVPEGRGPTGTAVREGTHFVCDDIENDPRMEKWRTKALKRGYRSSIALPLKQSGKVVGVFSLYSSVTNYFNSEEIKLLSGIVDDIGFALEAIETEKERKEAEIQLLKLSRAVEQIPVSIVITNLDGTIEYANPKACETTGYKPDELFGKNPRVLKSGETPDQEYKYLWDSISGGNTWRGIFHNKRKNGELYWESSQITPILDANGHVINYLAIKEDITERKLTQEALGRSEERFSQIAELSQTVIWEVNANGMYIYVSPVSKEVWGYEPEELVGKKYFYDLHPIEGREEFKEAALEVFARRDVFKGLINPIVTKSQKRIWVLTNGTPIIDSQNNLIGYRGADSDITERKQAEEAMKQSEEALNYAQQIANMGSWSLDLTNNKLTWSKNYYRLIGVDPGIQEVYNDYFIKIVHPEDANKMDEKLKEIHETKEPASFDFRIVMPDGQIKWIQNNIVPVFEGDQLVRLNGVNIDITDKKLTEEVLKINEEALNQAQRISKMCSWELDLINEKLTWSKNYYHLMGIPDGTEMKTEFFRERVHPEDLHLVDEKTEEMKVLKKPVIYDIRLRMPDDEYRWIQNNIVPEFEDEILVRFKGVNIDVTAKKQAEESIKLQNERLSAIIGAMPDLIFVVDKNGTCLEYYGPTPEVLKITDDQVIGANIKHVFDAETAQLHLRKIDECLQQQKLIAY